MDGTAFGGWLVGLISLGYVFFLIRELGKVASQLKMIRQRPTNAELQLSSKNTKMVALVIEINELLRLNKETYKEMKHSSEQFDMAINNIAHDLRTPLTVASGYTQYLQQEEGIAPNQQKELLGKINLNLKSVEEKLEELLTYNRISEQQVVVNLEQVNVSKLVEEQLFHYFESFQERGIELVIEIEPQVSLVTDRNLMSRVIQNALGNMLAHGEEQGEILLKTEEDDLVLFFSNQTSQVITDYHRLFERFYTEDLSRKEKNAGLGLFIIKELTTILGGQVELSGTETEFTLGITIKGSD